MIPRRGSPLILRQAQDERTFRGSLRRLRIAALALLAAAFVLPGPASASAVSITASLDRDTIEIGDTVLLAIRAEAAETTLFSSPGVLDLAPFEVRTSVADSTARSLDLRVELQIFETGYHAVPSITVHYRAGDAVDALATDTFRVFVNGLADDADTELRPERGIIDPAPPESPSPFIALTALAAIAALLLLLLAWRLLRKKPGSIFAPTRPRDPRAVFADAMAECRRLIDHDPPRMKEAFSLLTESLKHLILALDRVDVTGSTTTETLEHAAIRRWSRGDHDDLKFVLARADLVKFARMTVTRAEALEALATAERISASRYAPAAPTAESAPVVEPRPSRKVQS